MKPITREEMYLAAAAGYAVTPPEPVTRKEMFLAKLAGMEVETPAVFTRQERFLEEAAVALSRSVIEPLEVTENGTYTAPDGVDGYSPVVVNVATASADLKYVTFMSYDGTVEYGKKAVAVGDDCADPIARGIFGTPTRESTAQYNYTFYGWATEPNGGADANWNKAITEDKTVYANFTSTVRYYTITYYDGTTVLKTESLAYGATPNYKPTKNGYLFTGWIPALSIVTEDTSYVAQFEESLTLEATSWAKIAEKSADGTASKAWKVGDTKSIQLSSGGTITVAIAGFDHDDLSDGTGKAGISFICTVAPSLTCTWGEARYPTSAVHKNLEIGGGTFSQTMISRLPGELRNVLKYVDKLVDASYDSGTTHTTTLSTRLWIPSRSEIGDTLSTIELGTKYALFTEQQIGEYKSLPISHMDASGTVLTGFWLRSLMRVGVVRPRCIYPVKSGTKYYFSGKDATTNGTAPYSLIFGFCI